MQDYRRLVMWQRARSLTTEIYELTDRFPAAERFGLAQQMRRAAVSITSSIAEGCGRDTRLELSRFLGIASGSAHELESQMYAAMDLGFASRESLQYAMRSIAEIKAMLFAYRSRLTTDER